MKNTIDISNTLDTVIEKYNQLDKNINLLFKLLKPND